jgi:hypothetical protein
MSNDADAIFAKLFLSAEGRADPYPLYHQLPQTAPVHRTKLGIWLLSRYDDSSPRWELPGTQSDWRRRQVVR